MNKLLVELARVVFSRFASSYAYVSRNLEKSCWDTCNKRNDNFEQYSLSSQDAAYETSIHVPY